MKSVWIVTYQEPYDGAEIMGVYSTEVAARVFIEQNPPSYRHYYLVEEYEVREAH